ncbi:MAG TPA: hypothetical protein VG710_19235 [Opitutus sp.]|nr:hypothetical protein [Opitutus sp.]
MKTPPLLPEETLHRVLRVANIDGLSVLLIAGVLALAAAAAGDYAGAAIGLLVAAAGAIELHGAGLVRAGERRGMQWLVASQPYLLLVLLGYCLLWLTNVDQALLRLMKNLFHFVYGSNFRGMLAEAGYEEPRFYRMIYRLVFLSLAFTTVIYQGGMTVYYLRRRGAVKAALGEAE